MGQTDILSACRTGFLELAHAVASGAPEIRLHEVAEAAFARTIGFSLYTVMMFDADHTVSTRSYSSDPGHYPPGGTKPLERDAWYQRVVMERRPFIANTPDDWKPYYIDYEKVFALGLRSAINVPIALGGAVHGSINLLHRDQTYHPADADTGAALATLLGAGLIR